MRLLQHEHSVLWRTLADTNAVLATLKSAFDPLTVLPGPSSEVASVLGLAEDCRGMAQALRERLVGSKAAVDLKTASRKGETVRVVQIDTPAEEGLRGLLAAGSSVEQSESEYRCVILSWGIFYKHNTDVLSVAFKPIHLAPRSDAPDEARGQIASPSVFVQLQELHTLSGDRAKYLDEITQETLKAKAKTSLDCFEHFGT